MVKYADITPFYEWLDWLEKESNSRCPDYNTMMFYEIRDKLDDLPEVVRCEDCKNRCYSNVCEIFKRQMQDDCFCSYGERKMQ